MLSSKGWEIREQSHISATTHELPLSYICHLLDTTLEQLPFMQGYLCNHLQQLCPIVLWKCWSRTACNFICFPLHWNCFLTFGKKNADCNTRRCGGRNSWWNLWREWFKGDYFRTFSAQILQADVRCHSLHAFFGINFYKDIHFFSTYCSLYSLQLIFLLRNRLS